MNNETELDKMNQHDKKSWIGFGIFIAGIALLQIIESALIGLITFGGLIYAFIHGFKQFRSQDKIMKTGDEYSNSVSEHMKANFKYYVGFSTAFIIIGALFFDSFDLWTVGKVILFGLILWIGSKALKKQKTTKSNL